MDDVAKAVEVGGRSYGIARFRGLKAQMILRESAAIGRKYPGLAKKVAEFERTYVEENMLRLSRTEAELRYGDDAAEITNAAWESSGGELPLKRMPSPIERFGAIWPEIIELAEEPAMNLLALISLSNEELATADDEDRIGEAVKERRREILHNGDVEEIAKLAEAGYEVARGQFGPLVSRIRPLAAMMGLTMAEPEPTTSDTSPATTTPEPESSTSSATSPSSSTDSPPPTGGPEERPSTPPGLPSEPAPTG